MKWAGVTVLMALTIYISNSSLIRSTADTAPKLLAHRGVHQTYKKDNLGKHDCTASRIHKPQHEYLENTIESIQKAFDYGASMVEIDVNPTSDGHFVVFHDWKIDCRTNGTGITRNHTLAFLQNLDIGYGYTYDDGQTFPFRGKKGVAAMPSLSQVLDAFPEQSFLVNIKSNDLNEAVLVNDYLESREMDEYPRLYFYGGDLPITQLLSMQPKAKGFTKETVKKCALDYQILGWSGYMPNSCRDTMLLVPRKYASYLWGWPNLLVSRMRDVNTIVVLVDLNNGFMDGINDPKLAKTLMNDYSGMIWTDRIQDVNPALVKAEEHNP